MRSASPFVEVVMEDEAVFDDLIRRVRAGDEAAAAELVGRYEPEVRREVRMQLRMRDSRLRRVFDSMDIVQSVLQSFFARASAGQFDLDAPDQLRALLVAMARNKLAEQVRRQQRGRRDVRRVAGEAEAVDQQVDSAAGPSRLATGRDLLREVRSRLSTEECRMVEIRSDGGTWAEVADAMGGTPEGRRKQLSRAVDRVMSELKLDNLNVSG